MYLYRFYKEHNIYNILYKTFYNTVIIIYTPYTIIYIIYYIK